MNAHPLHCDLSIIIVNWNTRDLLAECLRSIGECGLRIADLSASNKPIHQFSNLPATEVFVVDNASSDGSAAMVREQFPWVRLIENGENVGFARANNRALHLASGRYILLLNSDTEVHPGALEALVAFMDATSGASACGPRLLNTDGSLQHACHPMLTPGREFWRLSFLDRLWPHATYPMSRWDTATPRPVEVIKGACLLLRREALEQTGFLDESYFMYTEEVDLCRRLAQAGWTLWYVPAVVVTHFGGGSSSQMAEEMYLQLYRSKLHFFRKFGGEAAGQRFKAYLHFAYWPRAVVASFLSVFDPAWTSRARTYRHLLAWLSSD